ncbi:MarR family winged helix-turn-helix transcriptional regulator [Nonomuraea wenchangensis]
MAEEQLTPGDPHDPLAQAPGDARDMLADARDPLMDTGGDARDPLVDAPGDMLADVSSWPVGRLLSVAARLVERRFHDFLAAHQLSHAGLIALHHLTPGPRTQRELAAACRVTDQTMSRTIEHLRRSGHVVKRADPRDRRRMLVELTPAGDAVLAMAREKERDSGDLLGAVEDYDRFREELIRLITVT